MLLVFCQHIHLDHIGTFRFTTIQKSLLSGLYTGFLPRGGELGVCQKEGGEAVRSCRAAAGGWGIQGGRE